ncbi:helix-turn-helix domain-containing protein [Butyrivibrio sp. JL13D10]|uniref:helix-turn-helix domain-containing protein n=1 Tax=Butyrivibrio sp. JL13D10 TaxID=3236815 RepID=UPI0038B42EAF
MKYLFVNGILSELAKRAKDYRLAYPLTQKELADKAGVSLRSVQKFEKGLDVQLDIFIKIMMALDLADNFNTLIPDMSDRPSTYLARQNGTERKRVRKKNDKPSNRTFKWGDEK